MSLFYIENFCKLKNILQLTIHKHDRNKDWHTYTLSVENTKTRSGNRKTRKT